MYRKKMIWLVILMVWVGMVTSLLLYQDEYDYFSKGVNSDNIEIIEYTKNLEENINQDEVNYTESTESNDQNFFIRYRLERDKARSEQLDIYREMINNPNTDKITKQEAQNKMLELTKRMEKEMEIESLVRARGYKDALAYIHDEAVDIIVQSTGLKRNDVAIIGDIVVKSTGFSSEDVTIIEKNE
ncbi:MAG: SpoIIIAH-like family protein [Bacillota bacterium]